MVFKRNHHPTSIDKHTNFEIFIPYNNLGYRELKVCYKKIFQHINCGTYVFQKKKIRPASIERFVIRLFNVLIVVPIMDGNGTGQDGECLPHPYHCPKSPPSFSLPILAGKKKSSLFSFLALRRVIKE